MSIFETTPAFSECLQALDARIAAETEKDARKTQQQIRRVFLAFASFVESLRLETPIETVVKDADTANWLVARYLVIVVKDAGAQAAQRASWALRQIVSYWQENDFSELLASDIRTPTNPPAEPVLDWLDLWSEELDRRYQLGFDQEGEPLPRGRASAQAISAERVSALRSEFVSVIKFALERLKIDCILGETDPELVWQDEAERDDETPEHVLREALADSRGRMFRLYLYSLCGKRTKATVEGATSNLRGVLDFLYAEKLCDFPASRLRTPSLNPEFPDYDFIDSWFDEIDRREALGAKRRSGPKTDPDAIAREFAQLLRRVFRAYLKFAVAHEEVRLELGEEGVLVSWQDQEKQGDANLLLEQAVLAADGHLAKAFIESEASRVSIATVRTTAAALRTALDHLRKTGFTTFDPTELKTPGSGPGVVVRPVRESSNKVARLPRKKLRKAKRKRAKKVSAKRSAEKRGIVDLYSVKVRRRIPVEESDAATIFKSRDAVLMELMSQEGPGLNFTEICFLRREWYDKESGCLRYLAGEYLDDRKMEQLQLTDRLQAMLSQYLELVEISAYSAFWKSEDGSEFGHPLFFASDGGNLVADDSKAGEEYEKGFFQTRDRLVTILCRRLGLSLSQIVALTRRAIDENMIREPRQQELDTDTSKAVRAWLQAARISGIRWDGAEDQLPLLMASDFDTLVP